MKKSSRFWWLHGAILVAAVAGCKSPYGGQSGQPAAGTPGMTGSAGGMMYNQSSMGMSGSPSGMSAGQSFAPQGPGAFTGPSQSSSFGGH